MFRKLMKGKAKAAEDGPRPGGLLPPMPQQPSASPAESISSTASCSSVAPVEYTVSPPWVLSAGGVSSPCPVEYTITGPTPAPTGRYPRKFEVFTPGGYLNAQEHRPVNNYQRPPLSLPVVAAYVAPIQYEYKSPVEMPAELPAELPGDLSPGVVTPPPSYEHSRTTTPRPTGAPLHGSKALAHIIPSIVAGTYTTSTPSAAIGISKAPTPSAPKHKASTRPSSDIIPKPMQDDGDSRVKKYTADVFCQRKVDSQGNRREEVPRDVREFRLAKIALIPIVAGTRRFVSFEVVFGEIDKMYSSLVEKHFALQQGTQVITLPLGSITGGQIYQVIPLQVAYHEWNSSIYIKFQSPQDESNFQQDFNAMRGYLES